MDVTKSEERVIARNHAAPWWRSVAMRLAPTLVGLLGMAAATLLYAYASATVYRGVFEIWGVHPFRFPFLDIDGPLAARDCVPLGFDVFTFNPCDILGRVHNYSPLWLAFPTLPLGQSDRVVVGCTIDLLFFLSLAFLPPAAGWAELLLRIAATVSTTVVYATERANVDVIIFILMLGTVLSMAGGFAVRSVGYALALLAAGLKYYPATLLALAMRERPVRLFATGLATAALAGWFVAEYGHDIRRSLPNIPGGLGFADMFGASDVMYDVSMVLQTMSVSARTASAVSAAVLVVAFTIAAGVAIRLWRRHDWPAALGRLDEARRWALLAGALVTTGCFVAGQSLDYRGIFFLLVLPGLFALGRDPALRGWLPRHAAVLIVLLMWEQAVRYWIDMLNIGLGLPGLLTAGLLLSVWIARELAFWVVMIVLASVVAAFLADTPVPMRLRRALRGHALGGSPGEAEGKAYPGGSASA